jgi:TetR/AcrR family tetracycline transcriptional repressor
MTSAPSGDVNYRLKPQRGRPARLSRPGILEAGLELIKATSIENLTMRTLAQALNVAPMSLYSHVKDKDDLLVGVAQIIFERLTFTVNEKLTWDQQLFTWMNDLRRQLHEFPQLPQLYTYNESYSASLLNTTVVAINILKKSGLDDEEKILITARGLMWLVLGYTTLESFVKTRTNEAKNKIVAEQLNNLPKEQRAILEPLKSLLVERNADQIFELTAKLMISGIKYHA